MNSVPPALQSRAHVKSIDEYRRLYDCRWHSSWNRQRAYFYGATTARIFWPCAVRPLSMTNEVPARAPCTWPVVPA